MIFIFPYLKNGGVHFAYNYQDQFSSHYMLSKAIKLFGLSQTWKIRVLIRTEKKYSNGKGNLI